MVLIDNKGNTNPYINLAIEEYIVRHFDCSQTDYLFLYINEPCIVLGKNQSIYKEVNFEYLRNDRLKLCRRISGGGTVYQDSGNLNFAFISAFADHKVNNYLYFNERIIKALDKAGLKAEQDKRNNIIVADKKVSGNAQFTNRTNIISHGTLLHHADLNELRASLKENSFAVETKAVSSVRSSVINLSEVGNQWRTTSALAAYLAKEFGALKVYSFTEEEWRIIGELASSKFSSYQWIYGRSPQTIIKKEEFDIVVEEGIITDMQKKNDNNALAVLKGVKYCYHDIKKALDNLPNASVLLKMVF